MIKLLTSKNIYYTKVSYDLINDYLAFMNDYENVGKYLGPRGRIFTRDDEIKWIDSKLANNDPVFSMIEKKSNEFIGNIELMEVNDTEKELGIAINHQMQNKGYGKEAISTILNYGFNELKLKKIILRTRVYNSRAIHVYQECGFKEYKRDDEHIFMEINQQ